MDMEPIAMKSFSSLLSGLPKSVVIEAIYLAGRELALETPSLEVARETNGALTDSEHSTAIERAKLMIQEIEGEFKTPVAELSKRDRTKLSEGLYRYLRNLTQHGSAVQIKANSVLKEFGNAAI
jgi:hypothetical protein